MLNQRSFLREVLKAISLSGLHEKWGAESSPDDWGKSFALAGVEFSVERYGSTVFYFLDGMSCCFIDRDQQADRFNELIKNKHRYAYNPEDVDYILNEDSNERN